VTDHWRCTGFGKDDAARNEVLLRTVSGGVTVNDCLFHFTQINQPMGGVGASGTGAHHGEWGFRNLSKMKPVFYRSLLNRLAELYPPYAPESRGCKRCCGSCHSVS
jgi:coniferyl-aldehyde dehydrogenase